MDEKGTLVRELLPLAGTLVATVLRTLLGTAAGMTLVAALLGWAAFSLASDGSTTHGVAGMLVAVVTAAVCGSVLASKRMMLAGARVALRQARPGRHALRVVFQRMLGVDPDDAFMARGTAAARAVERLPLAQAEQQLAADVNTLVAGHEEGGGLRGWAARRTRAALLRRVEAVTLAAFREEGTREGGVDLVLLHRRLGQEVDERLLSSVDDAMTRITVMLVAATCAVSLAAALGIRMLPR